MSTNIKIEKMHVFRIAEDMEKKKKTIGQLYIFKLNSSATFLFFRIIFKLLIIIIKDDTTFYFISLLLFSLERYYDPLYYPSRKAALF